MRPQDFRKLVRYVVEKQQAIYDLQKLLSFNVHMKNDPNECHLHISDDSNTMNFAFFEHDDYHNTKFEIDELLKLLNI